MSRIKFSILGGDYRYKYLYDLLKGEGYIVKAFDNRGIIKCENTIIEALSDSDVLIAPIPITKDNKNVFLNSVNLTIDELLSMLTRAEIKNIICGVVTEGLRKKCQGLGINIYDLFNYEEVAVKNAIPTAEGAIMTAMQESDKTLFGSSALVIGYGRCGKILSHTLKGIGTKVYVTYRKPQDKAYIDAYGMVSVNIKELSLSVNNYDFIFNTAPALVIDKEILKRVSKETIIIDLAQAPGGVDFSYAKKLGIRAIYCPGMPGRTAPCTAAEILRDIIISIAMEV
ncbi:MAG: dipicolinate synthase subunit DpsA [Lachnospirales bacterium]